MMNQSAVGLRLRKFEGSVSYMYRCTGGEVTVGCGHAILTAADAPKLNWQIGAAGVAADWAKVAAAQKGMVASKYAPLTACRMDDGAIDALLTADIQVFEQALSRALPRWASYPEPAQEALFDMAYNLGVAGLKKFVRMLAAVDSGQWEVAAQECERLGINAERNQETAQLFRQAGGA
jgi:type VI secretion system secreted protein VgrG